MADLVLTSLEDSTSEPLSSTQKIIDEFLEHRILVLNTEISDAILEDYVLYILKWNAEDNKMHIPTKQRKPIRVYINSPGGDLFSGNMLIDVIGASKTPVIGVAFSLVGSMAYHIYLACHERVAFYNTVFCQHEGNVAVANTTSKAKDIMEFFTTMDERLNAQILERTNMDAEYLKSKETNEYYMYADEAKEMGIVHKIIGKDVGMNYIL